MKKRLALLTLPPLALGVAAVAKPPVKAKPKAPAFAAAPVLAPGVTPATVRAFLQANCNSCHDRDSRAGGLDLTTLKFDLNDPKAFAEWVKVHDRVRDGEMPPKDMERPSAASLAAFLKALANPMVTADDSRARTEGRAVWRRMNRYEYENTLRDLLDSPWLQIKDKLPEDGESFRFNKVGTALDVSHVQMSRYLAAADYALREVTLQQAIAPPATTTRYYAREMRSFAGPMVFTVFNGSPERATFPILGDTADKDVLDRKVPITVGASDPARRNQEAFGVVASAYEPIEPKFDKFRAPAAGRYKLRLCAHSFWAAPENARTWWRPSRTDISAGRTTEPVTLYSESPPRQLRKLGTCDIGPQSTTVDLDVYLLKGETVRPDAVRLFRSRPPAWRNPLATPDGQPGVAFQWLEVQGPIAESNTGPSKGYTLLFGDLPVKMGAGNRPEIVSSNPDVDTARLMRGCIERAYRRPAADADIQPFVRLAQIARDAGANFTDSMITAYSAVLCSPDFVTLQEKPGRLDGEALASRLAYFLWNSEPDDQLRALGLSGELEKPAVLRAQTDRMLADPKAHRFVNAFLDYWLDLRKVSNTSPDAELYPDYYLDDYLLESSIDETRSFFNELIKFDMPSRNLVQSNFVMVNERLADLYGIPDVKGAEIRRVYLPKNSPRGGLLTQASVLKVTANGTTTSPVVRGAWITERIIGQPVPPPPPSVPAVDPDTRGATTIREQLAKHRTQATCKACHAKIDPPGFALENFDVCGGWRDKYRALGDSTDKVPGRGKNGQPFDFHLAQTVDASGVMPDGQRFQDVRELKALLASDQRQIARNLTRQLVIYGTGAPVRFGDRPKIEAILDQTAKTNYGVKSIVHSIVESDLFRDK